MTDTKPQGNEAGEVTTWIVSNHGMQDASMAEECGHKLSRNEALVIKAEDFAAYRERSEAEKAALDADLTIAKADKASLAWEVEHWHGKCDALVAALEKTIRACKGCSGTGARATGADCEYCADGRAALKAAKGEA